MKTILTLFAICACTLGFAADDAISVAIRKLSTEDRVAAVALLAKQPEKSIPRLHAELFPNLDTELGKLGAESFRTRRVASRRIIAMGQRVEAKVRAYGESSEDPEVRARCKEILQNIARGAISSSQAALMKGAVDVIMSAKAKTSDKQCRDILQEYLVRRRFYQKDNLAHLKKVLMFVAGDEDLFAAIGRGLKMTKDEGVVTELITYLVKHDAPRAAGLLEQFETNSPFSDKVKEILAGMDFASLRFYHLRKIAKLHRNDRSDYLKDLRKHELFDKTFRNDGAELLKVENLHANGLGIRFLGDQVNKHGERILAIIGSIKSSDRSWEFTRELKESDLSPAFISKNLDTFLNCPTWTLTEYALGRLDPAKVPVEKLMSKFKTGHRYTYSEVADYLVKKFPKRRPAIVATLEREILACAEKDKDRYWNLSQTLGTTVKYKGNAFDDWWGQQMKIGSKNWKSILLRSFHYLNVSSEVVLPRLLKAEDWNAGEKEIALLMKGSPEHQKRVADFLASRLGTAKRLYTTVVLLKPLIRVRPEEFNKWAEFYFTAATAAAAKNDFYLGDDRYVTLITEHLRKHPKDMAVIMKYLAGNKAIESAIALCLLNRVTLNAGQKKRAAARLDEILDEIGSPEILRFLLYAAVDLRMERRVMRKLYLRILKNKGSSYQLRELAYLFDERDRDLTAELESAYADVDDERKRALDVAILNTNPEHERCLERVRRRAHKDPKRDQAASAIELLILHGKTPKLSPERLNYLLSSKDNLYSVNEALSESPELALSAKDAILKNFGLIVRSSSSELSSLTWHNPPLQKFIVPKLMELLERGSTKERKFASNEIASTEEEMPRYVDRLAAVYQKEKDPEVLDNLLWATANIGLPAAKLAPMIEKRFSNIETPKMRSRAYFALSRISPDAKTRLAYAKKIRAMYDNKVDDMARSTVRMLGLVMEFDDEIHPFLVKVIHQHDIDDYPRSEAVWGLARKNPFSKQIKDAYRTVLTVAATPEGFEKYEDIVGNVVWAVRQDPESCLDLIPLLQGLPAEEQAEQNFWKTMRALRRVAKKKEKAE